MYARKILKAVETLEQQRGTGIQQGQNFNIIHYFFFLSPKVLAQCSLTVSWWANFPIRISIIVINLGSDTFGNPIFQMLLQN